MPNLIFNAAVLVILWLNMKTMKSLQESLRRVERECIHGMMESAQRDLVLAEKYSALRKRVSSGGFTHADFH